MQGLLEGGRDPEGRMRLLTEDGTLVVPDERLVERGYRYGVVVGRVLVKQFQSPEDAEECATALAGVAMDLLSAPDSDSDVAANNVSEEPFGCGREVSDAALGLSAIDDNRVDVMTALRLVADGDESAPAVVGAGGEVSTQLKTGDYLVNAIAGGETVVEGLLHVGDVYILGSDDKVGKTRTSHVAAYGVAAGRGFLDWPVPRARDVLFIEQDESEEDTGNTLSDAVELGLVSESDLRSGAVSYYNDFDANGFRTAHRCFAFDDGMSKDLEGGTRILTDRGLGKVISDWRGTHGNGRLVVIDCLSDVIDERHGLGLSVREDKATMAALSALAHELRVALLIVHHTTKWQADGSVADRLQGTRGVTAGATGTMLFQPDYEHGAWTGGGTLTVKGRCVPRSVPIVSERGFWRSISRESPEAYRPDEVVRAVHSWMMSRGSDWSGRPKELVGLASLPCDYRHLTKRLRAGREWMSRNGVEYSLGRLRGGYRSVTLALTDAGAEASRVKRSSFRGFETVARDGFGEGVTCTYEPAVTG